LIFERIFLDAGIAFRFKNQMVAEPVDAPSREELIALIQAQASQIATALSEQLARCQAAAIGCLDEESVSLFQQLAGGDPAGGYDVRQISAVAEERRHLP
jgi:hypothetical protein